MLVYHTTEDQIMTAADRTGVQVTELRENSVGIQFKLRAIPQADGYRQYRKINPVTGHKGIGVCFHGWHEFLRNLWEVEPKARVKTTKGFFNSYNEFTERLEEMDEELEADGCKYHLSDACRCA